ncbi:MAG: hypothetical protein JWR30_206, partial [Conexibacter sp.]|nr:hypothetical protein [Conexibacter sp.]
TDPRLLAATGITALAGTAYVAARSAGCVAGNDAGVILNHVRLIPCLVRRGVSSRETALTVAGTGLRQASGATRASIHVLDERLSKTADDARQKLSDHVVDPFRQGIGRVTGIPPGPARGTGGRLLFVGIGVIVGVLYALILTLWLFILGPRWRSSRS